MEEYDDNKPIIENGKWVNEKGENIDLNDEGEWYWSGRVTPNGLKNNGLFISEEGSEVDILSLSFTVPNSIKEKLNKEQKVMAILNAEDWYEICPNCKKRILREGMILMLEEFHIYPALCCNNMVWLRNGGPDIFKNMN